MNEERTEGATTLGILNATVILTGFGYFVDMYDFIIFAITRVSSLTDLGLSGADITTTGIHILNLQMIGVLIGAFVWGVLADKFGRKKCLLLSIAMYSLASVASAFVQTADQLALLRFITGFGLAGEVGAGIALIAEKMGAHNRGQGIAMFSAIGFAGVVAAGIMSQFVDWRTAYLIGGLAGFVLLFFRSGLSESDMFLSSSKGAASFIEKATKFMAHPQRVRRLLTITIMGLPFAASIAFVTALAPELAKSKGIMDPVNMGLVLIIFNCSWIVADIIAARFSDLAKSRKRIISFFALVFPLLVGAYFFMPLHEVWHYYVFVSLFGMCTGYFSLVTIVSAEAFGTDYRATASTVAPALVRGYVVPVNLVLLWLAPQFGFLASFAIIALGAAILCFVALKLVAETYGRDLNYLEP